MPLHALVPAAGRAERFGSAKLLAPWRERELLAHVLATLAGARVAGFIDQVIVVHRPSDSRIAELATEYLAVPVAMRAEGALADSLRRGIAVIRDLEPTAEDAILICLGDQPLLRLDVIAALAQAWKAGARAARPSYRLDPGAPGHPLLIARSLWSLAPEMTGDAGFGPVLARNGTPVHVVSVAGHNPDIDTTSDLDGLDSAEVQRS